jgi:DNA-binding MarR family transcriptional regulator
MPLKKTHKEAWIAYFVSHSVLTRVIDKALAEAGAVSLDVYDVLLALEDAPGQRLRMSDLADAIIFSRSGLTRLVDRLEREGLLRREACPKDRRACHAVLTEKGLAERERAWPIYEAEIQRIFADKIDEGEAKVVRDVFNRMMGLRK